MTNELSTERAIEALYTVRAYYASLTAGYPKGKDCRGIGDVMCSEIANSCLMAIQALKQQPCEDCISLNKLDDIITKAIDDSENQTECQTLRWVLDVMSELPSVTPQPKTGHWIDGFGGCKCSECSCLEAGYSDYCPNCGTKMEREDKI